MLMAVGVKVADTERLLMAQCCAGDLDAFEQVYRQYADIVFRHAFYLLGHHEDADDIKQETFLRAYRALQGFRQDSSLLTWLLKICSNLCYDRLKHHQRQPEIAYDAEATQRYFRDSPDAASHLLDPQAVLDRADTLQLLLQALQNMPLPQRNLIVLHLLEGLDYKEIGQVLGCAPGAAKMRVLRAIHLFKARATILLNAPL
jgi:RNA polymerase sigma-70 factor (ECF subfamily)